MAVAREGLNPKNPLPTRVIDVGPADGSEDPRVEISAGRSGNWAALSYCWGGPSSFTLRKDNLAKAYQNSQLTLAAARAPSSQLGILSKRATLLLTCRLPWSATTLETKMVEREHIYLRNRPSDTPDDDLEEWP
jgi:hypothetical protein